MRWTPGGISANIEDRRGGGGFGFGRGPTIGCGGIVILLILSLLTGRNFFTFFDDPAATQSPAGPVAQTPGEEQAVQFVSFVLDDVQNTWTKVLEQEGIRYQPATLVLFRDMTQSACGLGQAESGPFYCPSDGKVYIDLAFYDDLKSRFGAPGDFAQAYVLAHEIGHHVQNLLGVAKRSREESIAIELQADCYAGIWAHSTAQRDILERGDVEEGLNAAAAVGDDRIQKMSGRAVNPDSFTHGSSAQRVEWFRRGLETGNVRSCETSG